MALRRLPRPPRLGLRPRITLAFAASGAAPVRPAGRQHLGHHPGEPARPSARPPPPARRTRTPATCRRRSPTDGRRRVHPRCPEQPRHRTPRRWSATEDASGNDALGARESRVRPGRAARRRSSRWSSEGSPARMRYDLDGDPRARHRHPAARAGRVRTSRSSRSTSCRARSSRSPSSLFGASLVTTLAGAALGYWISRRTLRPLSNVGVAAEAIAGGRLDTRLEGGDDPDLEALVTSFNHMAQALEERIERDGRFASDVSHELRSPLMTLAASIEVLATRREEMPDESAQAAVDLMAADIARFQQLVDDLLEISALRRRRGPPVARRGQPGRARAPRGRRVDRPGRARSRPAPTSTSSWSGPTSAASCG